jgi:hypothetical protein
MTQTTQYVTTMTLAFAVALAVGACGSNPIDPSPDAQLPDECASTEDCSVGFVCDVAAGVCTAETLECVEHADCGDAAACVEGVCERNTTGGLCQTADDCYAGDDCNFGVCGCAGEQFVAEHVPPNVLIVLDRSGSMGEDLGNTTKWDVAVSAVDDLLDSFGAGIRFGLVLYSADDECTAGQVEVDVADGSAANIRTALSTAVPDGYTPIGGTIAALEAYAGLQDTSRDNYILLLTDGEETCDGDGAAAVEAINAANPSVRTFVVGFGAGVDPDALNAMAVAGGTALDGATDYYQADDATSLDSAFADIAADVLGCTYDLDEPPAGASQLYVYVGGEAIEQGGADGWSYAGPDAIAFAGASCELLRSGDIEDVVVAHGCPVIVP